MNVDIFLEAAVPLVSGMPETTLILPHSHTIDGMVYTRGSAADYDRWASVTGDEGWSWLSVQQYIRKVDFYASNRLVKFVTINRTERALEPTSRSSQHHRAIQSTCTQLHRDQLCFTSWICAAK